MSLNNRLTGGAPAPEWRDTDRADVITSYLTNGDTQSKKRTDFLKSVLFLCRDMGHSDVVRGRNRPAKRASKRRPGATPAHIRQRARARGAGTRAAGPPDRRKPGRRTGEAGARTVPPPRRAPPAPGRNRTTAQSEPKRSEGRGGREAPERRRPGGGKGSAGGAAGGRQGKGGHRPRAGASGGRQGTDERGERGARSEAPEDAPKPGAAQEGHREKPEQAGRIT